MWEATGPNEPAQPSDGQPSVGHALGDDLTAPLSTNWERDDAIAASEQFQTLAHEVRITVLVELLAAEVADTIPVSFSRLQTAAGADSSAGFAYHLRQLTGQYVTQTEAGYVLTPAGRQIARMVIDGNVADGGSPVGAS